jgi:hypothetical protein
MIPVRFASQLLNVRMLWPFLLATICVAIFGDMVEKVLEQSLGKLVPHTIQVSIIMAVLSALFFWLAVVLFKRQALRLANLQQTDIKEAAPKLHKGLILLVSRAEPCRQAIKFHQPLLEQVWLICSTRSKPEAEVLQQEFPDLMIPEPIIINNIFQPSEVTHQVNEIYRHLPAGWKAEEVIADCTGMPVQSSIGVALACLGQQRPLQYTPAIYNDEGRVIGSGDPIELQIEETLSTVRMK